MIMRTSAPHWPARQSPMLLILSLLILAVIAAAAGAVGGFFVLFHSARNGEVDTGVSLKAAGLLLGGFAVAVLLRAVAWIIQWMHLRAVQPARREPDLLPGPGAEGGASPLEQIAAQLQDISASLLLTDTQRQAKREAFQKHLAARADLELAEALQMGSLPVAQDVLNRFAANAPGHPHVAILTARLEEARLSRLSDSLAQAVNQAESLLRDGQFGKVQAMIHRLEAEQPDTADTQEVIARIRSLLQQRRSTHREGLYRQVEYFARKRQWNHALELARQLVTSHPGSHEAEIVAERIPTLSENARIEQVRHFRDEIRENIQRKQYGEAAALAAQVVEQFPETAAAQELRDELPKLRSLAQGG